MGKRDKGSPSKSAPSSAPVRSTRSNRAPTAQFFQREAIVIAREAYTENFSSWRGTSDYYDGPYVYLYDNYPYRNDPGQRDREHTELIALLTARGFVVVARASYPTSGESKGYTVAIVFDVSRFAGDVDAAHHELRRTWEAVRGSGTKWTPTGRTLRLQK